MGFSGAGVTTFVSTPWGSVAANVLKAIMNTFISTLSQSASYKYKQLVNKIEKENYVYAIKVLANSV